MDAGAIEGTHPHEPAIFVVTELQVADVEQPVECRVEREAAHPLETDPGLVAAGCADRDAGVVDGQQVVKAIFAARVVFRLPRGKIATISTSGERMHKASHTAGAAAAGCVGRQLEGGVQKLLGHESIQTTADIYVDWDLEQLAASLVEALAGEEGLE